MKIHSRLMAVFLSLVITLSFIPSMAFAEDTATDNNNNDGNFVVEEQLVTEDPAIDGEDGAVFEESLGKIIDFIKSNPEASNYEIIKFAYTETLGTFSDASEQAGSPSEYLAKLLNEFEIDSVFVTGIDADGNAAECVFVRPEDGDSYYVVYPAADIGNKNEEFEGLLLGGDALQGWTLDEKFADDEFTIKHPLSEGKYEPATTEDKTAGSEEADAANETNQEEKPKDKASDAYGAAETVYASGTCGPNATWRVTYTQWPELTLRIEGKGTMNNYSTSGQPWRGKSYTNNIKKIVIDKNISRIGDYAFYNMTSVKNVVFLGTSLGVIGRYSFAYLYGLENISIPSGVAIIEERAFYNCYSLKKVTLPESLRCIYTYAFAYNSALSSVIIPSGIVYLGDYAFYGVPTVYYAGDAAKWERINGTKAISATTQLIYAKKINGAKVTTKKASYVFTSNAIKPSPVVKIKEGGKWKTLKKGTDYTLSYKKNKNVGTATVIVKGTGKYYGSVSKTFKITKRSLSKAKVTGIKNRGFTGKARTLSPVVKVKIGKKYVKLKKGRDYTVKYKNNKKISTGKSRAVITITGKGNYKGKLSRKFKIVKGSPGLYFAKKTVKRPVSLGNYTQKPKKKVKGKMTYTYSSSKPSVATVNKKTGKVTPKKIGTTVITVKNKATKNYKAGKATYKLTVRALTKDELKFNFANYITNEIPLGTFRLFYNPTQAKAHYRKEWNIGDTGVCFGMSAGSGMLRTAGSGLTPAKFKSGAKKPSQLSKGNRFKSKGVTLKDVIEAMHLSQAAPQCQKVLNKNTNNIKGLVATVKSGYPAIICMKSYWGSGGHAVEGYKFKKLNKEVDVIYVYDSSNFSPDGCIYLYKNNKGKYIDWYYSYSEGFFSPAAITYIPGKTYRSIWKNRKAAKKLGQMYVSSDNFKILGSDGKVVAEMKDGDFSSTSEDIFLAQTYDFEFEDNLVILPSDKYTVQDTSGSSEKLTVTSIDENQSIEVTTDATAVVVETVDDNSVNKATLKVAEGESYEVSVLDGTGGGEPDEIVFTGEGTGKAITLGTDDGDCIVKNAGDVQLEINGVEKDFTVSGGVAEIK